MERLKVELMRISDYLHYIYLLIFICVVFRYYLLTTMFELYYINNIYRVVRWLLIIYVIVSVATWIITQKYESWGEIGFMVALLIVALIVQYIVGDEQVLDIVLLVIGAKNVPWKEIAYCYLCIAIIVQIVAYFSVNAGVVSNMTYESDRGLRKSFGIIYPTDFMAHILFIEFVYVSFRDKRLTFVEIIIMELIGYMVYQQTGARNDFICVSLLCLLLCVIKSLRLNNIFISKFNWIKIFGMGMLVVAVMCIVVPVFYDGSKQFWIKLDSIISNRVSLSYQAIAKYAVTPFGSKIQEGSSSLGYYFFIDSSYIRIGIRYGWIFLSMIIYIYMLCFNKIVDYDKDYMIIVMLVMLIFGITEHHLIEIAYCPIWYMLFSCIDDDKRLKRSKSR